MDFLVSLAKDVATIFFTTFAAGIATRIASQQLKGKRKTTPRRPKRNKGGNSHR